MLKRVLCAFLVYSAGITISAAERTDDQRLDLSVAVPSSNGERSIRLSPHEPLHVILRNVSANPLRIWKESNSWGYYALQFEVTTGKGERRVVRKKQRGWRKNVPDFWVLESGESLVHDVFLAGGAWENVPIDAIGEKVSVRAIFEVPRETMADKLGVWIGQASSGVARCVLRE